VGARRRPERLSILLLALLVAGSACAKDATSSLASAKLSIFQLEADVAHGQTAFVLARDQQPLALNDTVRTDSTGFAEIDYPDHSLTRLDANTSFTVTRLVDAQGRRAVSARLDLGRSWNRVEKISGSGGFSITTPNAVASVRGTVFVVACDAEPRCQFIDFEGSIDVHTVTGQVVTVGPGQEVDVGPDGTPSAVLAFTGTDLWFTENQAIDQGSPPPRPSPGGSPAAPTSLLHVKAKVVSSKFSTATCTETIGIRWTPNPADPGFQGDAVIDVASNGVATTQTVPWTGAFLQVTFQAHTQNALWTLDATLVSVGGTPVDPAGAKSINAGSAGLFSGC
jgi:hypothetical protein